MFSCSKGDIECKIDISQVQKSPILLLAKKMRYVFL